MMSLLQAVARQAEAGTPDADLLERFARDRDNLAFEELVRRHGPLVWAVCRHMLPDRADAEDAFQAVFLALVRSASSIRDGNTVPAWLHGVAVRVATKARRDFARRRAREQRVAQPEATRPIADSAWEGIVAAVHEEVQRLPEAERTAFVLCDLEGVSQADAAARLGWPLGSVSGRLCKARQRLMDLLNARGIAPTAAIGVSMTAGVAGGLPPKLFDVVKFFPSAQTAASSAALVLARGLTEGVAMNVKLMLAATVVVATLGFTGGAVLLSEDGGQPGVVVAPPPAGAVPPMLPSPATTPGAATGGFYVPPGMNAGGGIAFVAPTWEYKFVTVPYNLKDFEKAIIQQGKEGSELCCSERFDQTIVLVFKKYKAGGGIGSFGAPGGIGGGMPMPGSVSGGGIGGGSFSVPGSAGSGTRSSVDPERSWAMLQKITGDTGDTLDMSKLPPQMHTMLKASAEKTGTTPLPKSGIMTKAQFLDYYKSLLSSPGAGVTPMTPMGGSVTMIPPQTPASGLTLIGLKHATADEMGSLLKRVFRDAEITADQRSNQLIVRADAKTLEELKALLTKLDVEVTKAK